MIRFRIFIILAFFLFFSAVSYAVYAPMQNDMPLLRAVLCKTGASAAMGTLKGIKFFVRDGDILCDTWKVEQIRRKSVLFRRLSDKKFIEIFLNNNRPVRRTRDITFIASQIELFDALQLAAMVFDMQVFMSCESVRAQQRMNFAMQPKSEMELLKKLTKPDNNKVIINDNIVFVLPEEIEFKKYVNLQHLEKIYSGLSKKGWLIAENEDIQSVLRRFANGSGVSIMFDENLHFPVYAAVRDVKFLTMLEGLICINNCNITEYEKGIEISK